MRKTSKTSNRGTRKRTGKLSRRALLSALGSGLALTALGSSPKESKGGPTEFPFEPPTKSSGTNPFAIGSLKEIVVDGRSNSVAVHYGNKTSTIQLSEPTWKSKITINFTNKTVSYMCYQTELTPTPNP
jgi:hypothetical protein